MFSSDDPDQDDLGPQRPDDRGESSPQPYMAGGDQPPYLASPPDLTTHISTAPTNLPMPQIESEASTDRDIEWEGLQSLAAGPADPLKNIKVTNRLLSGLFANSSTGPVGSNFLFQEAAVMPPMMPELTHDTVETWLACRVDNGLVQTTPLEDGSVGYSLSSKGIEFARSILERSNSAGRWKPMLDVEVERITTPFMEEEDNQPDVREDSGKNGLGSRFRKAVSGHNSPSLPNNDIGEYRDRVTYPTASDPNDDMLDGNFKMPQSSRYYAFLDESKMRQSTGYKVMPWLLLIGAVFGIASLTLVLGKATGFVGGRQEEVVIPAQETVFRHVEYARNVVESYFTDGPLPSNVAFSPEIDAKNFKDGKTVKTVVVTFVPGMSNTGTAKAVASDANDASSKSVGYNGYQERLVFRVDMPTSNDSVQVSIIIAESTGGWPVVATYPTLLRNVVSPAVGPSLYASKYFGSYTGEISQATPDQISAWASAWSKSDQDELKRSTGDQRADFGYVGLGGYQYVPDSLNILDKSNYPQSTTSAIFRVFFLVAQDGTGVQRRIEMDLLINNVGQPFPTIVAWSSAGSGYQMEPFGNAISSKAQQPSAITQPSIPETGGATEPPEPAATQPAEAPSEAPNQTAPSGSVQPAPDTGSATG